MATSNPSASNPRPPGPAGGGSGFPLKTALAILVMVDALLGWRLYMDRGKGIDSGIFEETFRLRWPQPPAPIVPKPSGMQPTANGNPQAISAVFVDDANSLDPFFAALWKLEQANQAQSKQGGVITILHYGD